MYPYGRRTPPCHWSYGVHLLLRRHIRTFPRELFNGEVGLFGVSMEMEREDLSHRLILMSCVSEVGFCTWQYFGEY
jgi:hypothetical protein